MVRFTLVLYLIVFAFQISAKDYSRLYSRVNPSVVVINSRETQTVLSEQGIATTSHQGLGSGVIISKNGKILTASHVVNNANQIIVELSDGRQLEASVLTSIVTADLALVQIVNAPADLSVAKLGDSLETKIGEEVFVVGAPYGLAHTLTTGHLSGRRTQIDPFLNRPLEFLQTDAAINQGNSGGPLFNNKGEVIGIVSHIKSKSGGNVGLGFAASINMARDLILGDTGYWWGMQHISLDEQELQTLNVPGFANGLLVQHVATGSLAANLGIRASMVPITLNKRDILIGGDVIVKMGGQNLYFTPKGLQRIRVYLESLKSGEIIEVTVFRNGNLVPLTTVKL